MNRAAAISALIRRNAEACETATRKRCECACGGQFHGQHHSTAWVMQVTEAVLAARATADADRARRLLEESGQGDLYRGTFEGAK